MKKIHLLILGFLFLAVAGYFWYISRQSPFAVQENVVPVKETKITYQNKDGFTHTVSAYEGRVKILVNPEIAPSAVNSLVRKNNGKIIAQASEAGIYLAQVPAGREAKFISALLKEKTILTAFPDFTLAVDAYRQIDDWKKSVVAPSKYRGIAGKPYYDALPAEPGGIFELTADKNKAATHGEMVHYFLSGKELNQAENAKCLADGFCLQIKDTDFIDITNAIANNSSEYLTFNLSYGVSAIEYENKKSLPESEKLALDKTIREEKLDELLEYLNIFSGTKIRGTDKTIIIKSAGNSGTDLTEIFENKMVAGHAGLNRLLMVGATDQSGKIADYSNYSRNSKDIIYAPVKEKIKTGLLTSEILEGTSFAAPQIAYLVNKILDQYPQLARQSGILKEMLFDKAMAAKKIENGITYYVIEDPYSPATLKSALALAKTKIAASLPQPQVEISPEAEFESDSGGKILPPLPEE